MSMSLEFLRQNPVNDFCDSPVPSAQPQPSTQLQPSTHQQPAKKFSKSKFSLLLGSNLIVWVIFIVSLLNLKGFSMNEIPIPNLPCQLTVSGIIYHENSPSVIISKQVYGLGDVVDGYTIVNITRTEVEFRKGDHTIVRQVR